MAYNHSIVAGFIESSPGFVGDRDICEGDAGFESEFGDNGETLTEDQREEGVFGLFCASFLGPVSSR
jgi:hypothetical protein